MARILSCQCRLQQVQFRRCPVFAAWRKNYRRLSRKHRLESVDEVEEITWSSFYTVGFKCFFWPQMDPRQSIDDILDEPLTCVGKYLTINKEHNLNGTRNFFQCLICLTTSPPGSVNVCDHKSPAHSVPGPSPPPPSQADQSQASQLHKDDSFLPSPLCSSLLLELPPSPAVINPSQVIPAPPPPPPICTSPRPSTGKSRKRRAPTSFDAADWLETLTSGLRPLTPPAAPFVESDFSLDSDLSVSRVLDLMIEKW